MVRSAGSADAELVAGAFTGSFAAPGAGAGGSDAAAAAGAVVVAVRSASEVSAAPVEQPAITTTSAPARAAGTARDRCMNFPGIR
ncbi:hypothetical protein [Streptomyces sp. MS2.AVA.5]|uniref:Uncharacterized protein n=1 Tax=Streptomyces achmelvichensis TaxID=3134111 RepID=A0ACC6PPN8_9ACTN